MRAAYAALILGLGAGFALATGVLSSGTTPRPATVAATLALDRPGTDIDRRRAEAVAVLVARCMTRLGIAWVPWVEAPPAVPDPDLGPVEWAERWGFGVSTTAALPPPQSVADPNLMGIGRLGPDERGVARRALHGHDRAAGCQAAATTEVHGLRERQLAPLRQALDALDRRIATDPAALRLLETWRACVGPVAGGMPVDRGRLSGALLQRVSDRLVELGSTPAAIIGLAAIQAEERRVATVLARCEEAFSVGRAAVAAPHEAAFVEEHRAALERIGAAIREAEVALPTVPP